MDIFTEYIIEKKKKALDYAIMATIIAGAVVLTYVFVLLMAGIPMLRGIGVLLLAAAWWGALKLVKTRNVEYEYILTNNELDIDKIIGKNGRKRLCTINFSEIEQCANITDSRFLNVYNSTDGKIVKNYAGDIDGDRVYFVDYSKNGERRRVIFQPNEKILNGIRKANPRLVAILDKDIQAEV